MESNVYRPSNVNLRNNFNYEYVGFIARSGATIIDTVIIALISWPILTKIYGDEYWQGEKVLSGTNDKLDFLITYIFPAIFSIVFWIYKQATPGKIIINSKIVDSKTGGKPSILKLIVRYLAYYVSLIPFGLGIFWVGFDKNKQGWHDKLAGTFVVRAD